MHEAGIEDADWLPLVFAVIIFTVVLAEPDGHAIGQIARTCARAPHVWLLIGANLRGPAIGQGAGGTRGTSGAASDPAWGALRWARMSGLLLLLATPAGAR